MFLLALLAAGVTTSTPTTDSSALSKGSMGLQFAVTGGGTLIGSSAPALGTAGITYFLNDGMALRADVGFNAQLSPSGVPVTFLFGAGVRMYQMHRGPVAVYLQPYAMLARVPGTPDATISIILSGALGVEYFFTDRFSAGGQVGAGLGFSNLGGPTGSSVAITFTTENSNGLFASFYF